MAALKRELAAATTQAREARDGASAAEAPPPPSRTKWTRLVHPSVLIGHVSSTGGAAGARVGEATRRGGCGGRAGGCGGPRGGTPPRRAEQTRCATKNRNASQNE